MAKKKLTLSVEESVIPLIKDYANELDTSVSALFEDVMVKKIEQHEGVGFTPKPGSVVEKILEDAEPREDMPDDHKEIVRKQIKKKYSE